MNKFKWIPILAISMFSYAQESSALTVAGLGGLNYATPSQDADAADASFENSADAAFAFGGILALPFGEGVEFETGLFYRTNTYTTDSSLRGVNLSETTYSYKNVRIPALLRFTALPIISFGGGVFYEIGTGQVEATNEKNGTTVSQSFADSSLKDRNYGLALNARLSLPLLPTMLTGIVDVSYDYGLRNLSMDGDYDYKSRNLMALIGIGISI